MAQIPTQTKINQEDIPDDSRSWMSKVIAPINQFVSQVVAAFNHDISFTENIRCQIKEISFVNNPASFPLSFRSTLNTKPFGVLKLRLVDITSPPIPLLLAPDIVTWDFSQNGQILINSISGLEPDQRYQLTVLVL